METLYIIEFVEIHPIRIKVAAEDENQAYQRAIEGFGEVTHPGPVEFKDISMTKSDG